MTARQRVFRAIGLVVVLVLAVLAVQDARGSDEGNEARSSLTIVAPAAPGGGWDLVAREAQAAVRDDAIVVNAQVVNVPGAGGTIGLSQLQQLHGNGTTLMVTGTVMLGGIAQGGGSITLDDTTPIARLAKDFEVIAVPANSEYEDFEDLIEAWRADPHIPIGGGSAGGIDHLVAGQLARAAGIDTGEIQYTPHAGGGELTLSLLSNAAGTVDVGISGFNDFRDLLEGGQLRALAVVAPERLEGMDTPTMAELGYPQVDLVNWRGFVAPPGITEEERAELLAIVTEMAATQSWAEAIEINRWEVDWAEGAEFETFLEEEQERISVLLEELGLI